MHQIAPQLGLELDGRLASASRHPDSLPQSCLDWNLQCLGLMDQNLGLCLSLGLEHLVHIPWFAGCCLPQRDDSDIHCDVQAMANVQIIFMICVITLCTFSALNEHIVTVASSITSQTDRLVSACIGPWMPRSKLPLSLGWCCWPCARTVDKCV